MDLNQPALFHPFYGFGTLRRDPELGCRFTTLPKEVIRLETANSTLSEEMRVLYVAMTRAKEKLIAVAALSDPEAALKKAAAMTVREKNAEGVEKLLPFNVSRAGSYAEWLLACALCHPSGGRLRAAAGLSGENVLPCASPWEIELVPAAGAPAGEGETAARPVGAGDEAETRETVRRIAERLSFRYRWGALSRIPSKISVSEVAEAAAQPADEAYPAGRLEEGRPPFRAGDLRPSFLSGEELTGAEKGTALHAFMQYARFDEIRDEAQVRQECRRLEEQGFLLGEQARSVAGQSEKILNFLHSELYARIAGAKRVYREFRFNLDTPAVSLYNKEAAQIPAGESVLLQGMADLIFETEDGCYLLDYKTDRVGNGGEDELVRRYGTQLRIYAKAVEEMMEKTVKAAYLYAFALDKAIKI
jgi:ATP-dependent helicase/nuclease subunit A